VSPESLSRRDLLRRAATMGAVALGAWAIRSGVDTPAPADGAALMSPPPWRSLAASLRGTLVLPSSQSFDENRLHYNSRFAARSGGHSYGGYSSSPRLIIDVSEMNAISVGARSGLASVGAGAELIDAYNTLGQHQRLLPGGSCPTVGIAGFTLGDSTGVFARK
jgi:hypothetical protein